MKLDWKHINLESQKIDLTWFPTKTLQPRWAPISDNLKEILTPFSKTEGFVIPRSHQRLRKLREKAEKAVRLLACDILRMRCDILLSVTGSLLQKTLRKLPLKLVMTQRRSPNGTGDRF